MKRSKKICAFLMALILTVLAVPLLPLSAQASELPEIIEGDVIYDPTLTGDGNGVPEGWMAGPEVCVPWINKGASGGWKNYNASNKALGEINTQKFTFTDKGLAVNGLLNGEFTVFFPDLKDSVGVPVENYAYTMTLSGMNTADTWSVGPITDAVGGENYVGGSYFMAYASKAENSHRFYAYSIAESRQNDLQVKKTAKDALTYPADGRITITVYHIDGINYYFFNDQFVSQRAATNFYSSAPQNRVGIHFCGTNGLVIEDITVKKVIPIGSTSDALTLPGASVRYCNVDGTTEGDGAAALRFAATVDKTSDLYRYLVPTGTYDPTNENVKFGMLILPADLLGYGEELTVSTPKVSNTELTKIYAQNASTLTFTASLLGIPRLSRDRLFTARLYVKYKSGNDWKYIYSSQDLTRNFVGVANRFYQGTTDTAVRERLAEIFDNCRQFQPREASNVAFSALADFHYKANMYMSSIADIQAILDRANNANVDFIVHAGDFSNDYKGSPELFKAYLENSHDLPALGVYGNHELETSGNSMAVVTPLLTNANVVWGTVDGKFNKDIGHYYYDTNGFRIVCLDTNYSFNPSTKKWEHNTALRAPSGNTNTFTLGDPQLLWLEQTLIDAAYKNIPCIIISHMGFSGEWYSTSDAPTVREIFKKANSIQPGTVMMSIAGHLHTDHAEVIEGVLHLDLNTVRNGSWISGGPAHYTTENYDYVEYDANGNPTSTSTKLLKDLSQGKNTWFFKDPISAIVHVSSAGNITVEGQETSWLCGIEPPNNGSGGVTPKITSASYNIPLY